MEAINFRLDQIASNRVQGLLDAKRSPVAPFVHFLAGPDHEDDTLHTTVRERLGQSEDKFRKGAVDDHQKDILAECVPLWLDEKSDVGATTINDYQRGVVAASGEALSCVRQSHTQEVTPFGEVHMCVRVREIIGQHIQTQFTVGWATVAILHRVWRKRSDELTEGRRVEQQLEIDVAEDVVLERVNLGFRSTDVDRWIFLMHVHHFVNDLRCFTLSRQKDAGRVSSNVVVSEGVMGRWGIFLANELESVSLDGAPPEFE